MAARRRLPHSAATRAKIAAALTGRPRPDAVRAAIATTLTGRKHTEAAKAKMRAARAARPKDAVAYSRDRLRSQAVAVHKQWRADMRAALRLGDALFQDVKQSNGWRCNRKLFDSTGAVSHGFTKS